jgi:hypothetical protein
MDPELLPSHALVSARGAGGAGVEPTEESALLAGRGSKQGTRQSHSIANGLSAHIGQGWGPA